MTPDEIEKAAHKGAASGTKAAIEEDRAKFYVDAEEHYNHHQFIEKAMSFLDKTAGTAWGAFIRIILFGLITALVLGLVTFVGKEAITTVGKEVFK